MPKTGAAVAIETSTESPGIATLEKVASKLTAEGKEAGRWNRFYTKDGVNPFDTVKWKSAVAEIRSPSGEIKFKQEDLLVPEFWNQTTINVVANKYFRWINGTKENSIKQVFLRVAGTLRTWGFEQDYFNSEEDSYVFHDELIYALIHQKGAFNSPVWFNLGVPNRKQAASACFISGVEDTLDSIMNFSKAEKVIFAAGSGSGASLSKIRSSYEKLSSGAFVCGPLGWMEELDKGAKAMKSGGSTRNAAKMVVLDMDHPDILETQDGRPGFIRCKAVEEKRAHDLIDVGYSASYDDPNSAYKWVSYQNANHSVSIPDDFMRAVEEGGNWQTISRTGGDVINTYEARHLWNEMAAAAWFCGDPGVQFSDTINDWHTTPNSGRINASNPCFHPDTRIATEFGLIRIEDLCSEFESSADSTNYFNTLVQTQDGPCLKRAIVFPTGVKPVIEVHTRRGRILNVTPNHQLMTTNGWVKAEDLNEDSVLRLQSAEGAFSNSDPDMVVSFPGCTTMWYKIAGWIVGDGWILDRSPSRNSYEVGLLFGKHDKDVMKVVLDFFHENDIPFSSKVQDGSVGESPDYVRVKRKAIWEIMSFLACKPGSKAPTKRVMESVFRSTRQSQLAFLSGLFSADGTFNIQPKKNVDARFSSTSLDLLRDVQAILLNLGINSTIYKDRRPNGNQTFSYVTKSGEVRTYYSKEKLNELIITGESLRTFKCLMIGVGLLSERKQERFNEIPNDINNYGRDRWVDEVVNVVDNGEVVPVFDLTEDETNSLIAEGIIAHNCAEFLNSDNTACNLCAVNLTKFFSGNQLDVEEFAHAVRIFVTAQNAIIAKADYPTEEIRKNSHALRPIGLNYGDLGALIMKLGYSYDSDEGRVIAARMASLMTGYAYLTSAKLAARVGAFSEFEKNRVPMLSVIKKHQYHNARICDRWNASDPLGKEVIDISIKLWKDTLELGEKHGYSVSQATLQAPLGCLVAGSLIATDRGLTRIEDLGDPDGDKWQDVEFSVQTDEGPKSATKFYVNGVDDVIQIESSIGYILRGTPKHQIKIVAQDGTWEWKRFDNLQPGDIVPLSMNQMVGSPNQVPLPNLPPSLVPNFERGVKVPSQINLQLAELVGAFAANGSLHHKGLRIAVYGADTDVLERYSTFLSELFGKSPTVSISGKCTSLCLNSTQLRSWWESCGFSKIEDDGKLVCRVPDAILASNCPEIYGAYLRGLFTCDGSISNGLPSLTNKYLPFLQDVKTMLLCLGIPTRSDDHIGGYSKKPVHRITVQSQIFNEQFLGKVGFSAVRKQSKITTATNWSRADRIPIPNDLLDRVCPVSHPLRKDVIRHIHEYGSVARHLVEKLSSDVDGNELSHLLSFYYDPISSTELLDRQPTYDLSVPENVTYIANGFVSHNTISFLMGMDTTGIEPSFSLVSYKSMVGGGFEKLVNGAVPQALENLGYSSEDVTEICNYLEANDTIEGAPNLLGEHLPVFDCAVASNSGVRFLSPLSHLKMMAAIQPLITCAQSKTVNLPSDTSVDEIADLYFQGWKLGLKCIALYRDGCKKSQPLATKDRSDEQQLKGADAVIREVIKIREVTKRRRMPEDSIGRSHRFEINGHKGYITINQFDDGTPGEVFVRLGKSGSTMEGLVNGFTQLLSIALQYGVPLSKMIRSFVNTRFEPCGFTRNPKIRMAQSVLDYLFKYMDVLYFDGEHSGLMGRLQDMEIDDNSSLPPPSDSSPSSLSLDAPPCSECGSITRRNGACYLCDTCGASSGCS